MVVNTPGTIVRAAAPVADLTNLVSSSFILRCRICQKVSRAPNCIARLRGAVSVDRTPMSSWL
jgi:ssDNA-binding replication factor A large subunit